jgi:hypothetical protein
MLRLETCMLYLAKFFSCCKGGFFRLKLTFELIQFNPNESSPNHKTTPTQHRTKPNRTVPKPILIDASAGTCNKKTAL